VDVPTSTRSRRRAPGQYAKIEIVVEPLQTGRRIRFRKRGRRRSVPKEYVPGVEKGLESVLGSGVLAGFPVVDLKVTLVDGDYHDVDSSALAFRDREVAWRCAKRCRRAARFCSSRS